MNRFFLLLGLWVGIVSLTPSLSAQDKKPPTKVIGIHTSNGWLLDIYTDGSGYLQFGSNAQDGWKFKSGTLDVKQAEKDLKALTPDDKVVRSEKPRILACIGGKARQGSTRSI
jgi:hypothetical protein